MRRGSLTQREVSSLAKILSDPENSARSAEEVAQLVIDELDSLRAGTDRLAVVGQLRFGPQEPTHTVVLGPFRSPLLLRGQDRFEEVIKRPCTAAREAGQQLAWDSKTGTGEGRFMLAPAFLRPRDAWDYFRPPKADAGEPMNLLVPPPPHIAEAVERWRPGLWAEEFSA